MTFNFMLIKRFIDIIDVKSKIFPFSLFSYFEFRNRPKFDSLLIF